VARNSVSGDFARDWEHVFLLRNARTNSRPGYRPPLWEALIGWKLVIGYPVRIHEGVDGKGRPLGHRPSWRVPPLWEAPSDGPENRLPYFKGPAATPRQA
jgi:hypothetical protein